MRVKKLLRKLEPLMPKQVRKWRRSLDLADPELRSLLEKQIVLTAHKKLGNFRSKLLLSLPPKKKSRGPIDLGTILYEKPKWPAGISEPELLQNMAVFGRSGAGKTNVAFLLLEQLAKKKIPFLFLDWKRTARHLIPKLGKKVRIYTPGRKLSPFPFNPFLAPPGLEPSVYVNHVVDVMAHAYTLGDGSRSVLQKALRRCYEDQESPTITRVLEHLEKIPDKGRVRGWKTSAIRALEALATIELSSDPEAQEELVESLLKGSTIVELNGLSPSSKKFLLPLLCLWIYYMKLSESSREELNLVIFIEEAHHILHSSRSSNETLMEMLLRQCREIGIGIVVIDQHPSLISKAALGNTYTSICMNLKDPRDINKAAALCLLDQKEKSHFSMLPVGQGVVKLQDRWRRPFLVQFPLLEVSKGAVSDEALRRFLAGETTLSGLKRRVQQVRQEKGGSRVSDNPLGEDELRLVEDVLQHEDDGVDVRYQRLSMSADKGNRLKNQLLQKGILEEQLVRVGRTQRMLLRVASGAARDLGIERRYLNRGSIAHEYWKRWYARRFRQAGYKVELEAPRKNGYVDVLARRGSETVAVEIETGKSDVVWNVQQNLLSGFDQIIVVTTEEATTSNVQRELAGAGLLMSRVKILLRATSHSTT